MVVVIVVFAIGILSAILVARSQKYRKDYRAYLMISGPFLFAAVATVLAHHLAPRWQVSDRMFWGMTTTLLVVSGAGIIKRRDWILWRRWWTQWKERKQQ